MIERDVQMLARHIDEALTMLDRLDLGPHSAILLEPFHAEIRDLVMRVADLRQSIWASYNEAGQPVNIVK